MHQVVCKITEGSRRVALSSTLALIACAAVLSPGLQAQQVSETDVQAALKRCSQCHGPNLQMSKLDLSTREGMLKGGEKGPAIVPGDAEASPLYRRISGLQTPAMPMAPVPALNAQEIELVKNWINQGAKWTDATPTSAASVAPGGSITYPGGYTPRVITDQDRSWWAFKKPVAGDSREWPDARWSKNPIDALVAAKRNEKGLKAAPIADRNILIRRVYLDLIGLLPPPAEVDAFVKDPDPNAYEKLVDKLLNSKHYGERWARKWLDVARYADGTGYEYDYDNKEAWRYRDYVIKAFNEDKPYDQFVIEQLAGDELQNPSYDALTATGFVRLGPKVYDRDLRKSQLSLRLYGRHGAHHDAGLPGPHHQLRPLPRS